jgi:hypothetical protein
VKLIGHGQCIDTVVSGLTEVMVFIQRSIRGDCYVKREVSVSKRLICEHGKFICICSNKGTESDQNY